MSTETCNFNRQSVCVTCLSQDRKLIAMTDSQACTLSHLKLSLNLSDMICWECRSFVRRMVKFKSRAQTAQQYLWYMTNGLHQELPNLSPLTTSNGVSVDILPDPSDIKTEPPELMEVMIKQEFDGDWLRPKNIKSLPKNASTSASYRQTKSTGMSHNDDGGRDSSADALLNSKFGVAPPSRGVPMAARVTVTADSVPTLMKHADDNDDIDIDENRDATDDKTDIEMSILSHVVTPEGPANKSKGRKKPDKSHSQIINSGSNQCIYTEKALSEDEMIQWRQTKAKTEHFSRSIPSERCEMCIEIFDHERFAKIHAKRHTEDYGDIECTICHQRVVDERAMAAHRNRHYRLLKCQYCPFAWDDANTLRQHGSVIHYIPQTVWDCDQCERQFPSSKLFQLHAKSHRYTKCRVCDKHVTEQNITRHMLLHEGGVAIMTCAVCGGHYRGAGGLRAHMLTHRTEAEDNAYCVKCDIQFKSRFLLGQHMRSGKHASKDEYRFECDHCGRKFLSLGLLRNHMEQHSDTLHPCQQCQKVYKTQTSLRGHTRKVHEGKARLRNFICDHCGKTFHDKRILLDHTNTHTGVRPYVCKLCGDAFGHKSALYLHGRYKHKIQKKNNTNKIDATNKIEDTGKANKSK